MRRTRVWALGAIAASSLVAVPMAVVAMEGKDETRGARATASIIDATGAAIGTVQLTQRHDNTVTVRVRAEGLAPGFHGFHLHAAGVCDRTVRTVGASTGPFLTAGPHLAAPSEVHGDHVGDFPPLYAQADGTVRASADIDAFAVADLFDEDGTAAMIHADPDNLANIPDRYSSSAPGAPPTGPDAMTLAVGDSGGRVACGVMEETAPKKR